MADKTRVERLRKLLEDSNVILKKDLIQRAAWGEVDFQNAELDLKRCQELTYSLSVMPLEYLTDTIFDAASNKLEQLLTTLNRWDGFTIKQGNAMSMRDSIVGEFHTRTDEFYNSIANWIPFLAYQKGDVSKNIEALNKNIEESSRVVAEAKSKSEESEKELQQIISRAREASASAGAAVFTEDFRIESEKNDQESRVWLIASICLSVVTVVAAALFILFSYRFPATDAIQAYQILASKIIILMIFLSATLWCGRNYRVLKHLKTSNKHRSLTLRTLQAFAAATSDEQTKNAVLLEANRAIFSSGGTGYIDDGKNENPLTIIEFAKSLSKHRDT